MTHEPPATADPAQPRPPKPAASARNGSARHETARADAAPPPAKTVAESAIVMSRSMQPPDANVWGNVHGGAILRLVDEAGGAVAIRHSRRPCVTVAMDSMTFKQPVYIGDLLTIRAYLTYVGRTSMEVEAHIEAENLRTGEVRPAGTSYLIYVALDDHSRPMPVPPLELRTKEERARWRAAEARREQRHLTSAPPSERQNRQPHEGEREGQREKERE